VQPLSDDTAHEFRLGPKPELLIEVPSVARLEPDVLTWHSLCQVLDHPRPDASATNGGLGPDIKKVGVAHLIRKHSSHADQFAVEPSERDVLRPLEGQPQGVGRATVVELIDSQLGLCLGPIDAIEVAINHENMTVRHRSIVSPDSSSRLIIAGAPRGILWVIRGVCGTWVNATKSCVG
jgi:hypothetical protein